jgi:hypothetical protein
VKHGQHEENEYQLVPGCQVHLDTFMRILTPIKDNENSREYMVLSLVNPALKNTQFNLTVVKNLTAFLIPYV